MRFVRALAILTMLTVSSTAILGGSSTSDIKSIAAARVNGSIKIDGILDEHCWLLAEPGTSFVQFIPDEGEPATERTEFRVLYDDEYLYVGVWAYDSCPDSITTRLSRRDVFTETDAIFIGLDTDHDHQTGYAFGVTASGTLLDAYMFDDVQTDLTWDGAWTAKTSRDEKGWYAEYRIPFKTLRFQNSDNQVWGFNLKRYISRKREEDWWSPITRSEYGVVSKFGHVTGLENIVGGMCLDFYPYVSGKVEMEPGESSSRDFAGGMGLDVRYKPTPGTVIDITANPDFGQVEADPAVLNLSAYETFYPEKRPFFMEGAKIFATPFQLFYSRRIGRAPNRYSIPDGFDEISRPEATTILGAVKIVGRSSNGLTYGLINAVTDEEYVVCESKENSEKRKFLIEPLSNYLVFRLKKEILGTNSHIGLLGTSILRRHDTSALTGGIDWSIKFLEGEYAFEGQIAGSRTYIDDELKRGYAAQITFSKQSGEHIEARLILEKDSPEFEINELGYIRRNDFKCIGANLSFKEMSEHWKLKRMYFTVSSFTSWNTRGDRLFTELGYDVTFELTNHWWTGGGGKYVPRGLDDRSTRGGPVVVRPAEGAVWWWLHSDSRKRLEVSPVMVFSRAEGNGWAWRYNLNVTLKPDKRTEITLGAGLTRAFDPQQWVDNIDTDEGEQTIFGELESRVLDISLRVALALTPRLSFDLYAQPFVAFGKYSLYKRLLKPYTSEFEPYPYEEEYGSADFAMRSLRANFVFRWEFLPSSVLYLVYSRDYGESGDFSDFDFSSGLKDALRGDGQDFFMAKITYLLAI